ncbi:MAG: hypothetical protein M3400_02225 [Actinomycetota bacterium]|nr:hypothetical protein [Actinomycetota bacterium]
MARLALLGGGSGGLRQRAVAELTTRRVAKGINELPFAVEEVALALSCSRTAAGTKVALALDLAERQSFPPAHREPPFVTQSS